MNKKVINLYKEAASNKEFQNELKEHEIEYYKPKFFWGKNEKAIYISIYLGWLIGKGKYSESIYN